MNAVNICNQQRKFPVRSPAVRKAAELLMKDLLKVNPFQIAIHFVNESRMAELNETHLNHAGPTDIITFDYSTPKHLHGELIICPAVAVENSKKFRVSLGREYARYLIHGVLHLLGYSDQTPAKRRKMKAEENRLLQILGRRIPLNSLAHG